MLPTGGQELCMSASNASDDQADLSRDNFGNRNLHRYYTRDPGKIDLKAVIWVLLIGAAAGVGLGIAYAIIGYFASPFLLGHFSVRALCVAVCLCWLYGAQLGRLTERALRAKKVRSAAVWFAVLVFVVLLSLYISWVCTATLTTTGTLFDAKNLTGFSRWMNPQALAKFALKEQAIGDQAFWITMHAGEALFVLGCALGPRLRKILGTPFCERCNDWITGKPTLLRRIGQTDLSVLKSKLEAGDFSYVAALPAATPASVVCEDRKARWCEKCRAFSVLTVTVREWKKKGSGGSWVERVLLGGLSASANDIRQIAATTQPSRPIDPSSGTITLDDSPIRLGRWMTLTKFGASPLFEGARKLGFDGTLVLPDHTVGGTVFRITLHFDDTVLIGVDLMISDKRFGTSWEEFSWEKEMARKAAHEEWLAQVLGVARLPASEATRAWKYPWERVESYADKRSDIISIGISYNRKGS
jgi:hypothetical protein